jgi:hypothetical protein
MPSTKCPSVYGPYGVRRTEYEEDVPPLERNSSVRLLGVLPPSPDVVKIPLWIEVHNKSSKPYNRIHPCAASHLLAGI